MFGLLLYPYSTSTCLYLIRLLLCICFPWFVVCISAAFRFFGVDVPLVSCPLPMASRSMIPDLHLGSVLVYIHTPTYVVDALLVP